MDLTGYKALVDEETPDFRYSLMNSEKVNTTKVSGTRSVDRFGTNRQSISYVFKYDNELQTGKDLDLGSNRLYLYYRVAPVCKLTDGNGNLLYLSTGNPAIFAKLETPFDYLGECYKYETVNGSETLVKYTGSDYKVMMLVDNYELGKSVSADGSYNVTLTTEKNDTSIGNMTIPGAGSNCTISRGYNGASLFSNSLTSLTLDDIKLDGSKDTYTCSGNGGLVSAVSGSVKLGSGAELVDSKADGNGSAVYVYSGASLDMDGGNITENESTASKGGAIGFDGIGSRLNLSGNAVVKGNSYNNGEECNVYLDMDSDSVINVKGTLGSGAEIGVYVPGAEGENSLYDKHGIERTYFASYSGSDSNLDRFVNDRNGLNGEKTSSNKVWWKKIKADLTVTNENSGTYSNAEDSFEFVLTLKASGTDLAGADDARLTGIKIDGTAVNWDFSDSEKTASYTLTLDGQKNGSVPADSATAVISNIPTGWTYTLMEVTGEDGKARGYSVTYKAGSETDYEVNPTGKSGTLNEDTTVSIRNIRDNVVVSGIVSRSSLKTVIALAALSIMTAAFFIIRRRRLVRA